MTKLEKEKKITELKDEAKELQLRYAYLKMQMEPLEEELKNIRMLMQVGERKYQMLEQAGVEPEPIDEDEHA